MKLVVRSMGSFLIAALAVILIISSISYILIPGLSEFIKDTFPEEKNIEFVSVIASDPDSEHTAPADEETYETDDYIYTYSVSEGGWSVGVKDKNKSQYSPLSATIYNQPVISVKETFQGCTSLTQAPAIPSTVTNLAFAFKDCSSLTGMVAIFATPTAYEGCFSGTVQPISLMGSCTILSELSSTASGNVGVK